MCGRASRRAPVIPTACAHATPRGDTTRHGVCWHLFAGARAAMNGSIAANGTENGHENGNATAASLKMDAERTKNQADGLRAQIAAIDQKRDHLMKQKPTVRRRRRTEPFVAIVCSVTVA